MEGVLGGERERGGRRAGGLLSRWMSDGVTDEDEMFLFYRERDIYGGWPFGCRRYHRCAATGPTSRPSSGRPTSSSSASITSGE